jgi:hypothetical protein
LFIFKGPCVALLSFLLLDQGIDEFTEGLATHGFRIVVVINHTDGMTNLKHSCSMVSR